MKPTFVVLFVVFCLVPCSMSPARQEGPSGGTAFSPRPSQMNSQRLPGGQQNAQTAGSGTTTLLNNLPLYFVENKGQVNDQVRYYAKIKNGRVFFTGEEIVYQFLLGDGERGARQRDLYPSGIWTTNKKASIDEASAIREESIRVSFVGANKEAKPEATGEQETKFSYFRGNDPQKWVSGARSYQEVTYRDLYPGIDLLVSGREGRMKNEYVVRPGGEPTSIRVKYEGAKGLAVNKKGQLEIQTSAGMLIEDVPLSYQIIDGTKREVRTRYRIATDQTVRFQVGAYRKNTELIIDPLTYSTFLGGNNGDHACGIAVDGSGNAYVVGYTASADFPTASGAYDTGHSGSCDVFITKLNSSGSALLYSTFLGGTGFDFGYGIAVDTSGNAYVIGSTYSNEFPTTPGAYDNDINGQSDVFITKLNFSGSILLYSSFLGGSGYDGGHGIAIDESGSAYLTGYTDSSDFPTTPGAFDTSYNGGEASTDVFVTKINSSGSGLVYSTFLGGPGGFWEEDGNDIAVDASGNAYVTGNTDSFKFPTTAGAFDTSFNGDAIYNSGDAFITKLNSSGSELVYSTYLGGLYYDSGRGIEVDASRNAYVIGETGCAEFPTTAGCYDASFNGSTDAFITKINSSGSALLYSTFLGAYWYDYGIAIALDGSGNAYVSGTWNYREYDAGLNESQDAFVTKLDYSGSDLLYSTFLGGSSGESGVGIAVDTNGNAYVTGNTNSSDFPTTSGAYDTSFNGNGDVFITKLPTRYPDIRQPITAINFGNVNVGAFTDQATTIYNDGDDILTVNSITLASGSSDFAYTAPGFPFAIPAWSSRNITVRFTPTSGGAKSAVFIVNSDDPDEPDVTFDVSGTGVIVSETVSAPATPSGPASGQANTSYAYSTGGSTSSLVHDVQYLLDWGDGTDSGWLAVGTTSAQKSWSFSNTYYVKAKARCATDTSIESSWSSSLSVVISGEGYDNSPNNYKVLPECVWAAATGGGTWVSEVQITDITGESVVLVYFNYGGGNQRGPFTLWTSSGADRNIKYSNLLSSIDAIDAGAFTYFGRVGAVEFLTQDASHKIQVTARTLNSNYSKTFPGLNLTDSNTANIARRMMIQNFVNNATHRSSCGLFNPTADSVTVEFRLLNGNGNTIGSPFSRTLVGYDFQSFSPFNQAGVPYPSYSYDDAVLWVTPTSGSGKVMVFGASANNTSNDPAAHIGVQYQGAYDNSPSDYEVIPEGIWAAATGGGTWVSEVQITDITGGSTVSVYFDYGAGNRRGPFTLWTSPGANQSVKYFNILSSIDALDSEAFTYYGRVGAMEFLTQDAAHKIQVTARTLNGNYSKTFPGLNLTDSNTADTSRRMMIQNFVNNATYRSSCGFFNPTADPVTIEIRLVAENGNTIGSAFSKTLVGHDFQSFSPFNQAGVPYPSYAYDNVVLWITPTSGLGKVMVFGASANNASNDPAAHLGVQYQ